MQRKSAVSSLLVKHAARAAIAVSMLLGCSALAAERVPADAGAKTRYGDHELFTRGPYTAFMDPYNRGKFVAGVDFSQSFEVDPAQFPNGTRLKWDWPVREPKNVLGFLQVGGFGDYFNTVPKVPVPPRRVNEIDVLAASHKLQHSGTENGYDVIYDWFLTATPHGGDTHLFEVEVFVHTPQYSMKYFRRSIPIGRFESAGVTWNVAIDRKTSPPDILFVPADGKDLSEASIDLKAMHSYLVSQKILTGNEYYNGHSLGVEPAQGSGSLFVESVRVEYK